MAAAKCCGRSGQNSTDRAKTWPERVSFAALATAMTPIAGFECDPLRLLLEAVDHCVEADNPVRFIDAFVDGVDLAGAGFERVQAKATGRPGYARLRMAASKHSVLDALPAPLSMHARRHPSFDNPSQRERRDHRGTEVWNSRTASDPDKKGAVIWQYKAGGGDSGLGGIEWGLATDGEKAYIPVSDIIGKIPVVCTRWIWQRERACGTRLRRLRNAEKVPAAMLLSRGPSA